MIITIDGPAGSGKSSTARLVAGKLGAVYIDTGAMYRAVTLIALEKDVDVHDEKRLESLASEISIELKEGAGGQVTIVNGEDRSEDIRKPDVDRNVSTVASHKQVRAKLVELQRRMAGKFPKVVLEGRDTGSVVFPEADYKFFITAGQEARSRRRAEQVGSGNAGLAGIANEISKRDRLDSSRETSPLKIPEGAKVIDNTKMSLDETVQRIVEFIVSGNPDCQI
jgi:cytidylate kinase